MQENICKYVCVQVPHDYTEFSGSGVSSEQLGVTSRWQTCVQLQAG